MKRFNLSTIKTQARYDMLAIIKNKLMKILRDERVALNWMVFDMDVSFCDPRSHGVYVRLKIENHNRVIFFDDFHEVESNIKKLIKGASNFTLGSGTLTNPRVGFNIY